MFENIINQTLVFNRLKHCDDRSAEIILITVVVYIAQRFLALFGDFRPTVPVIVNSRRVTPAIGEQGKLSQSSVRAPQIVPLGKKAGGAFNTIIVRGLRLFCAQFGSLSGSVVGSINRGGPSSKIRYKRRRIFVSQTLNAKPDHRIRNS
jgi:hypothetical protein